MNQTIKTDAFARQNPVCAESQEDDENMGGRSLKPAEGVSGLGERIGWIEWIGWIGWNGSAGTGGTPKRLCAAPPEPSQGLRGERGGVVLLLPALLARLISRYLPSRPARASDYHGPWLGVAWCCDLRVAG